ncbi:GLH-binding kinase 1 [Aphelenchoides bicaudatus]|nr:GLH-binding kinase 1 [Aphelenchoides bicaudatus]
MHGHVEIVEELLKNGADTTAKNDCNSTAWDLAVKYGYGDKLPMLKGALPNLSQKAQFYEINVRGYIFKVPSRYKNVEHCEKGGYGRVATAIDDLTEKEKDVVIKRVPIDFSEELPEKNVYREFMLLKIIKHPNIISLLNAYTPDINVDSFDTVYFVMPFVTSTLSSRLGPSNEQFKNDAVLEIIYKLLCGLKYMHMFGIVHRDLNPRNIGISENGEPIIFDLGLSRAETENFITNRVGTYSYMAPEIFLGIKIKSFVHMVKSDIWSLACIWIEMITRDHFIDNRGKPPHEYWFRILEKLGTPDGKFMNKIPNLDLRAYYQALSKYEAKSPSELIPAKKFHVFVQDDEEHINAVQQTISTMLKFDPEQRVSAQDLVDKFERMNWVVKQEFNVEKIEIKHFKETCKEARENPELWKDMLFNSLEEYKIKNDVFGGK